MNKGDNVARTGGSTPDDAALHALLEPTVVGLGLDLEAVESVVTGRRRRVSVIVDRDGGVDLDGIAAVSKAVSGALDVGDVMGEDPYTLEVTSPGVDRPLVQPRHWRRNLGRLVVAVRRDGSQVEGRIASVDDDAVVVLPDSAPGEEGGGVRVAWVDLDRGLVQIEFRRPEPEVK